MGSRKNEIEGGGRNKKTSRSRSRDVDRVENLILSRNAGKNGRERNVEDRGWPSTEREGFPRREERDASLRRFTCGLYFDRTR